MNRPTVSQAFPAFSSELETALRAQGRASLAAQVADLPILDRCRCGDPNCATFYTAPHSSDGFGPGHENVLADVRGGLVVLDVIDGRIHCVEVLDRKDVRDLLAAVVPAVARTSKQTTK